MSSLHNLRPLVLVLALFAAAPMSLGRPAGNLETAEFATVKATIDAQVAEFGASNVLVVFDIDNTTLATDLDIGSEHWFMWQSQLVTAGDRAGGAVATTVADLLKVQGWILTVTPMHAVEPQIPSNLTELGQQGVRFMSLTSRMLDVRDVTLRELERLAFPYATTAPGPVGGFGGAYKPYDSSNPEAYGLTAADVERFGLTVPKDVIFERGVMLTQGQHKGSMLKTILAKTGAKFDAIVFVDDRVHHLQGVQAAFETRDEAVTTVRYVHEQGRIAAFNATDKADVKAQWCAFSNGLAAFYRHDASIKTPFLTCE